MPTRYDDVGSITDELRCCCLKEGAGAITTRIVADRGCHLLDQHAAAGVGPATIAHLKQTLVRRY